MGDKIVNNFINFHEQCFVNPLKVIRNGFENDGVGKNIYICGLLICCGIDTLCGYFNGKRSDWKSFCDFIENEIYIDKSDELKKPIEVSEIKKVIASEVFDREISRKRNPPQQITISQLLYTQFRCGLVHSFSFNGQAWFYIDHINPPNEKFSFEKNKGLIIEFTYFYKKYISYWDDYKIKLLNDDRIKNNFLDWDNKLRPSL